MRDREPKAARVRPVTSSDAEAWVRLRTALWPESPEDHLPEVEHFLARPPADAACFIAEDDEGNAVGFAEVGLRRYAEGCTTSPVGYLEGVYVEPDARHAGHARDLVRAGEAWARAQGCAEMGSDRALDNDASGAFHLAVGFEEAGRIVCYRKSLRVSPEDPSRPGWRRT